MSQPKFIRDLVITLIVGVIAVFLIAQYALHQAVPLSFWLCLSFITVLTVIVHKLLVQANGKRPMLFVTYFMGSLTAKLFLSAMLILVIGLIDRPNLKFTAVAYFAFYAVLTFVEIKHLLPLVRSEND